MEIMNDRGKRMNSFQDLSLNVKKQTRFMERVSFILLSLLLLIVSPAYAAGPGGIDTNLKLWLDASDIDGDGISEGFLEDGLVQDGANYDVATWVDKSANGENVTQGTANDRPRLVLDQFGATADTLKTLTKLLVSFCVLQLLIGLLTTQYLSFFKRQIQPHYR